MRTLLLLTLTLFPATAPAQAQCTSTATPPASLITYPSQYPWTLFQQYGPPGASMGDITGNGAIDVILQRGQRAIVAARFLTGPGGVPNGIAPLWALHDPNGRNHGTENSVIWDFDQDGSPEVVSVLGPAAPGGRLRLAQLGMPSCGALPCPDVVQPPAIESTIDFPAGFSGYITGNSVKLSTSVVDARGLGHAQDIMVTDDSSGQPHIWAWDLVGGQPQFTLIHREPFMGQQGHVAHAYDLDGDLREEVLLNGVVQFTPGVMFPSACSWKWPYTSNNHADTMQVFDYDGTGDLEVVIVEDFTTKMLPAGVGGCAGSAPVPFWDGGGSPTCTQLALHGQNITVGRFLPGPDLYGRDGKQLLSSPKGAPFYNGSSAGGCQNWGSQLANKEGEILASFLFSIPCTPYINVGGPTGWEHRNVDWDGDRKEDEVFNTLANAFSIFQLDATPTATTCSTPLFQEPYQWCKLAQHVGTPYSQTTWTTLHHVADVFGGPREEILAFHLNGIEIVYNPGPHPYPGRYLSPWASESYRRRFAGPYSRTVDYQALPELVRVEVVPATPAVAVSGQVALQALGHYSDGTVADVTQHATWTSGHPAVASLSGNVLTGAGEGYAGVRATVAGIDNDDAALAYVSNDPAPKILYAGWNQTYLTSGGGGAWRLEARVADVQDDVAGLLLFSGGTALPGVPFNDDGAGADEVAGDGTWTSELMIGSGLPASDVRFEMQALDLSLAASDMWPFLETQGPNPVGWTNGFPLFPFASENFGAPPPVLLGGTGFAASSVVASAGGTVTYIAREVGSAPLDAVHVYLGGYLISSAMNDQGVGADQLAGDGIWTGSLALPPAPAATLLFEFLPQRLAGGGFPAAFGDIYPRLRIHN